MVGSNFKLNALFSLTKHMYIGMYFDKLSKALVQEGLTEIFWSQHGVPPEAERAKHEHFVQFCFPELALQPLRHRVVMSALDILN
eukprot:12826317-Heterocapsa_arctica.AAC.1